MGNYAVAFIQPFLVLEERYFVEMIVKIFKWVSIVIIVLMKG